MNRATVDTSMDGLPTETVLPTGPTDRPLHDKAVNDGPTTANGLLSRQPQTLDDRRITADFASAGQAEQARAALIRAGIPEGAVYVTGAADSPSVGAQARPADDTLIGRLRDAIVPDEVTTTARGAIEHEAAILTVTPDREQVEAVIRILQGCAPARFDADLERWRNKG